MEKFEPGGDLKAPIYRRRTWLGRVIKSFSKNFSDTPVGDYVVYRFRKWVTEPVIRAFTPGIYGSKYESGQVDAKAKYLPAHVRGLFGMKKNIKQPTQYLPVTAYPGDSEEREAWIIAEMGEHLKKLKEATKEHKELSEFLESYNEHVLGVQKIQEHEKAVEAESAAKGKDYVDWRKTKLAKPDTITKQFKTRTVFMGGKNYAIAIGEGTVPLLFEEDTPESPLWSAFKSMFDWQAWKISRTHATPPKNLYGRFFNYQENAFHDGDSKEAWIERTKSNFSSTMGDLPNISFTEQLVAEAIRKRFLDMGVSHVSGRLLAEAAQAFSNEFANEEYGVIPAAKIDAWLKADKVKLSELDLREVFAVYNLAIARGLPGSRFKLYSTLDKKRAAELKNELAQLHEDKDNGRPYNPEQIKLVEDSLDQGIDLVRLSEHCSTTGEDMAKIIPWTKLIVLPGRTLELSKPEYNNQGRYRVSMPTGAKAFYISRHSVPTISSEALTILSFARSHSPLIDWIVNEGKISDQSYGLFFEHNRQRVKNRLVRMLHDGFCDDLGDAINKFTANFGFSHKDADHFYLTAHEQFKKVDGAKFDHLRRRVAGLLMNLDEKLRPFYLSYGAETEEKPIERIRAMDERRRFMNKYLEDGPVMNLLFAYNQQVAISESLRKQMLDPRIATEEKAKIREILTTSTTDEKQALKSIEQRVAEIYSDDVSTPTNPVEPGYGEELIKGDIVTSKRLKKVAEFLVSYSDVWSSFIPSYVARRDLGAGSNLVSAEWLRNAKDELTDAKKAAA